MSSHWIQTALVLVANPMFFSTCFLIQWSTPTEHGVGTVPGKGEIPPWHVGNPESQESIPILPSSCNANSCYIITCQISLLALQGGKQTSLPFLLYLQRAQPVSCLLSQPTTQSSTLE